MADGADCRLTARDNPRPMSSLDAKPSEHLAAVTSSELTETAPTMSASVTMETFGSFYTRERGDVVGLLYVLGGSWAIAEEIAQDAFAEAFARWGEVSSYDKPGAWVRKVAIRQQRRFAERRRAEMRALRKAVARKLLHASDETSPSELPTDHIEVLLAIRTLPRRQAEVVALHYYWDHSMDEIADVLGLSVGAVKAHLHHARRNLKRRLETRGEGGAGHEC
jgi:RNA polymerase sigma factor (sigma-70 family)